MACCVTVLFRLGLLISLDLFGSFVVLLCLFFILSWFVWFCPFLSLLLLCFYFVLLCCVLVAFWLFGMSGLFVLI